MIPTAIAEVCLFDYAFSNSVQELSGEKVLRNRICTRNIGDKYTSNRYNAVYSSSHARMELVT